jgi:hypothetical protein
LIVVVARVACSPRHSAYSPAVGLDVASWSRQAPCHVLLVHTIAVGSLVLRAIRAPTELSMDHTNAFGRSRRAWETHVVSELVTYAVGAGDHCSRLNMFEGVSKVVGYSHRECPHHNFITWMAWLPRYCRSQAPFPSPPPPPPANEWFQSSRLLWTPEQENWVRADMRTGRSAVAERQPPRELRWSVRRRPTLSGDPELSSDYLVLRHFTEGTRGV